MANLKGGPGSFLGTKEQAKVRELLREAERAKNEKKDKDQFGLPPVRKGFVRGHAFNVRQSEELCEYGTLQIIEFDVADKPNQPGIPVRMSGTYFSGRLVSGALVDVPDPTPDIRPITPFVVNHSRDDEHELRAFYPGRGEIPLKRSLFWGVVGLVVPVLLIFGIILALHIYHIV